MFIGGFTLIMNPQSIAHLLNGSEHIYWILNLEGEVHSIWDLWVSGLQECKSNEFFSKSGGRVAVLGRVQKIIYFRTGGCTRPILTVQKVCGGVFNAPPPLWVPLRWPFCVSLCAEYNILMFRSRRLYYTSRGFDLVAFLKKMQLIICKE